MKTGYVPGITKKFKPGKSTGKSGPTIGMGFDIGQYSKKQIEKMGFDPKIVDIEDLTQFAGMTKQDAINYVYGKGGEAEHRKTFTKTQIAHINAVVKKSKIDLAKKYFNKLAKEKGKKSLEDRPLEVRTVFMSVFFQYQKGAPNFKKQVVLEQHKNVVNNLLNFTGRKNKKGTYKFKGEK